MPRVPRFLRRVLPLLVLCVAIFVVSGVAEACPNCKNGMSGSDAQAKKMAAGYYYSILFMLSMPFLIITSFSGWMYLAVRRARAERELQSPQVVELSGEISGSEHASASAVNAASTAENSSRD